MLKRKLERESRPEPLGGSGNAEMGTEDDVLLPLALPEGAPTAGSSAPSTPSDNLGVGSAVPQVQLMCRPEGSNALSFANVALPRILE